MHNHAWPAIFPQHALCRPTGSADDAAVDVAAPKKPSLNVPSSLFRAQDQRIAAAVRGPPKHSSNNKEAARQAQSAQAILGGTQLVFDCADDLDLPELVRHQ